MAAFSLRRSVNEDIGDLAGLAPQRNREGVRASGLPANVASGSFAAPDWGQPWTLNGDIVF